MKQSTPTPPTWPAPQRSGRPVAWPVFLVTLFLLLGRENVQAQSFKGFSYAKNADQTVTITGFNCAYGDVVIPARIEGLPVTSIGNSAFSECKSLTSVTIPEGVTVIGSAAFLGCRKLTSVTIPGTVTSIGNSAFSACTSLTSITIPEGVTTIGRSAFDSCNSLTSATIAGSVTNIGDRAFFLCENLIDVSLAEGLTLIGSNAFEYCYSLTRAALPASVTSIGDQAFSWCGRLTNITIPRGVTHIGNGAFGICFAANEFAVDALNPAYRSVDGVLFDRNQTTLVQCPAGKVGPYAIPGTVTRLQKAAFAGCDRLTSVTIPHGVTSIEDEVFNVCEALANITIPSTVTHLGGSTFYGCRSLTNVTILGGVTHIPGNSFDECLRLKAVYFQGNQPSGAGDYAFGDSPVTFFYLPGTTGWGSTFSRRPTATWSLPHPLILPLVPQPGVGGRHEFGFVISWATNATVMVEAAPTLDSPTWSTLSTHTIRYSPDSTNALNGWASFLDPEWRNQPARFYRLRGQ